MKLFHVISIEMDFDKWVEYSSYNKTALNMPVENSKGRMLTS